MGNVCADTSRFRLTHETSFVKAHASFWTKNLLFFYIVRPISVTCYVSNLFSLMDVDYIFAHQDGTSVFGLGFVLININVTFKAY